MENTTSQKLLSLLGKFYCLAALLFFFPSCSRMDPVAELDPVGPAMELSGPEEGSKGDCFGEIQFTPSFVVLPQNQFPTHDLAIFVTGGAEGVPKNCMCSRTVICVDLSINVQDVLGVGITASLEGGKKIVSVYENPYGYFGEFKVPKGLNSNYDLANPVPFNLCVDVVDGDILVFDFIGGLPTGIDPASIISTAGGICIVDNIDNPQG